MGCGRERLTFCFPEDVELFRESRAADEEAARLFPAGSGKFSFWELFDHAGLTTQGLSDALWRLAWKGEVSSDGYHIVRRGIEGRFRAVESRDKIKMRRAGYGRWKASRPSRGSWFRLPAGEERDALEREEVNRDRIRQVLQRCGVVYREILENELSPLRWGALFRSLRIMELSGEIFSGRFFEGIQGLQFASPETFEELRRDLPLEAVYWMNAADPASLCGVGLEALRGTLPARLPSTHVVFRGGTPVLVSRRNGREIDIKVPPEDPRLPEYLALFRVLTGRDVRPLPAVHVETINGGPAQVSPYKPALLSFGFMEDFKRLSLRGQA
jgi:ATP-dependent Lhr-like helicase